MPPSFSYHRDASAPVPLAIQNVSMHPPAVVVDYDPKWPTMFGEIRSRVGPTVADLAASVEHVGSTAVSGLAAKPIIDVDIVVSDIGDVPLVLERLVAMGYVHQGDLGIAGREAFKPPPEGPYHHLYVVVEGSRPHRDHIDLRDYLREHPHEAQRYAVQKHQIAFLLATDRDAYVRAKNEIVEDLLKRARDPH
jgi:GrpB-like predicted nucleotidyltransferase (UPF0157 family)